MVEARVFAISVGCLIVVPFTTRWFVGVVVGLPLMRRIMLQVFFIGVWLLSFETYDLQQFRLLNLIVRLALAR